MAEYGVIDLTGESPVNVSAEFWGARKVNLADVREQLIEIRNEILPVAQASEPGKFGLQTLEISLTIGAEGKVWFVAKGSLEASIKLTFGHPAA